VKQLNAIVIEVAPELRLGKHYVQVLYPRTQRGLVFRETRWVFMADMPKVGDVVTITLW
jgi:hypothetical protein